MITLIHGDDTVSSRSVLNDKKNSLKDLEILSFDGLKVTLSEIVTAVDSPSLFSGGKCLIIENFLRRPLSKEKEDIFSFLRSRLEAKIIFWEAKEIDKTLLNKYFTKEEIVSCISPLLMFRFLDALGISPKSTILTLFQTLLKQREATFVYTMLVRQIRFLLIAKDTRGEGLSELSSWQAKKFLHQASYFTLEALLAKYRQLLSLEYNFKSGLTPYSLADLLDIYLANL